MNDRTILRTGMAGTVVAAICCFTPVLVLALGAVSLTTWLAWLDDVLFLVMGSFVAFTAYGLWLRQRSRAANCCETTDAKGLE